MAGSTIGKNATATEALAASQSYPFNNMPSETGRLLGAYSEKVPPSEEQEQDRVHNPQTPRSPSRSNRIGRAFILLVAISLTLWSNIRYSQRPPSIDQRVDRILTETPLIGRPRALLSAKLSFSH